MALSKNLGRGYKKYRNYKLWFFVIGVLVLVISGYVLYRGNKDKNLGEVIKIVKEEIKPKKSEDKLISNIEAYLADKNGTYGYHIIELDDGRSFGNRFDEKFVAASTVKVAYFTYLYSQIEAGRVSPEAVLIYTNADYEQGTGSLQESLFGSEYKITYLAEAMITESDNVATQMLKRYLGKDSLQSYLDANGFGEIDIMNNQVSPKAMARFLEVIHKGSLISKESAGVLFGYMKKSITPTRLVAGVPAEIEVAHKIGSWSEAISDIGIVFGPKRDYAIAVYSEGVAWGEETDAVIAKISQMVYEFEKSF